MSAPPTALEPCLHLLVPFASASAPECQAQLKSLKLPQLDALLAELVLEHTDQGDDHTLSAPHERAQAAAMGIVQADGTAFPDGQTPWAAAFSDAPTTPQAWFTPCHFQVGMDQVTLLPADQFGLDDAHARPLFDALAPYCLEDGIPLRYNRPTRWHASGEALRGLACASLDRVSGRSVDGWMAGNPLQHAGSQLLKRLQSEAQMLFYTHPVNDAREAARQHIVNGFWVSGAGAAAVAPAANAAPNMPQPLRQAALRGDWAAWQSAWSELDATDIRALREAARRGEPVVLTLCGERHAQRWTSVRRGAAARLGQRFKNLLGTTPAWKVLESL
ncbi:phosphoglycerate mutase [Hydrogenophaga sp.]|uniref:phosphoglycerate mutase n=1 Tax=Hydrogenophaga sp. TaxID=1904254 RepID=UPI002720E60A|nr:phosphoglycerate mutase [Hydrogenophaga sp.]MDO8905174.1 phosphoglycerate mutase [Hydrogenophaga sp.]